LQTGDKPTGSTLLDSRLDISRFEMSVTDAAGSGIAAGKYIKIDHEILFV